MYLEILLEKRNLSVRALARRAMIPYTTMLNLVRGTRGLEKASAGAVYRIAEVLGVTMEELVLEAINDRMGRDAKNPGKGTEEDVFCENAGRR